MKSASERARVAVCIALVALAAACEQPAAARSPSAAEPACADCHAADYAAADHPVHAGQKPLQCAVCHQPTRWHPSVLNHAWPLTGAHAKAECSYCHGALPGTYAGTDRACVACHRKDYDASRYPGHDRFALTCQDCHDTRAFKPATHVPPAPPAEPAEAASPRAAKTTAPKHASTPKPATKTRAPAATAKPKRSAPVEPIAPAPEPARVVVPPSPPEPAIRKPDATSGASRKR